MDGFLLFNFNFKHKKTHKKEDMVGMRCLSWPQCLYLGIRTKYRSVIKSCSPKNVVPHNLKDPLAGKAPQKKKKQEVLHVTVW